MGKRQAGRAVVVAAVALSFVWLQAGCGGGTSVGATGRLRVAMTDQAGGYTAVVLAIREVRVVPAGLEGAETSGAMPLVVSFSPARVVDVATLQFQQQLLGEALVPVGTYQQLRLVLAPNPAGGDPVNYVIRSGETAHVALRTPSGQESGLKINGHFTVAAGTINALALDFDPARAIVEAGGSGNLNLKPTGVRLIQLSQILATYGTIVGTVSNQAAWSTAVVYVYPVGSTTPIAAGSVDSEDGSFRLGLPAGSYYLTVVATGFATYDSQTQTAPNDVFVVTVGADLSISAVVLVTS